MAPWIPSRSGLKRFWENGKPPEIDRYLPEAMPLRLGALSELVHIDLERRLEIGEQVRVESYLKRYPELATQPPRVASLVCAEFAGRRRRQPDLSPDEFVRRFPAHRTELLAAARLGAGRQSPPPLCKPIAMISFSCSHCGMKMKVKEQFAGKRGSCPACKRPIVVQNAREAARVHVAAGRIEGSPSSLADSGVEAGVTLDRHDTRLGAAGRRSLLALKRFAEGRFELEQCLKAPARDTGGRTHAKRDGT